MSTIINNSTNNSNNTIINQKTNRALLSNIKNTTPLNPNTSLKKSIGSENITSNNVNNSKKTNTTNKVNNNNKNILFTPSSQKSVTKCRSTSQVTVIQEYGFLDQNSITDDLKRLGVNTGGISPCSSPLKESVPITMGDLIDASNIADQIVAENITTTATVAATNTISLELVHTKTTDLVKKVYDADFFMSLKASNLRRPKEIDIVENHQKEIVISLPTTPFNLGIQQSSHNNTNNTLRQKSINNSITTTTTTTTINNPIFSPQVSPFKIAYSNQQHSSSTPSKPIVTPKKNGSASNVSTPASYYRDGNNQKSLTKKQNPIPFTLNNATATVASPNSKSSVKKVTNTPKSNKKSTIAAASVSIAITEDSVVATTSLENATVSDDASTTTPTTVETPKKLRESDPKRLAARQRQIDIGKMTAGYKNYIATVPKSKRKPTDPKTPNKNQVCSKRSWDGQVKKWRRLLHQYDPTPIPFNEEEIEKEMKLMELELQKSLDATTTATDDEEDDEHVVPNSVEN